MCAQEYNTEAIQQDLYDNKIRMQTLEDLAATRLPLVRWYNLFHEDYRRYLYLLKGRMVWRLYRIVPKQLPSLRRFVWRYL